MRCPRCAGDVPDRAAYCGNCGEATAPADGSAASAGSLSFRLPVSRGARIARAVVLVVDIALAAAGALMIRSYVRDVRAAEAETDAAVAAPVALPTTSIRPGAGMGTGAGPKAAADADPGAEAATEAEPATAATDADSRAEAEAATDAKTAAAADAGAAAAPAADAVSGTAPSTEPDAVSGADGAPGADAGALGGDEVASLAGRVGALVGHHQGELERCYSRAAKVTTPDLPLRGRIDLQFRIMPTGAAQDVAVVTNTTGSPDLASCLVGHVERWTFPRPSQPAEFVWPFEFQTP